MKESKTIKVIHPRFDSFRVLVGDNNAYALNEIYLYKENGEVYQLRKVPNKGFEIVSPQEIKRKTKKDFSKNLPFIYKEENQFWSREILYNMFLPEKLFELSEEYEFKFKNQIALHLHTQYEDLTFSRTLKYLDEDCAKSAAIEEFLKQFDSKYKLEGFTIEEINKLVKEFKGLLLDFKKYQEYKENYSVEQYFKELKK